MAALISVFIAITLSLLITRIATEALTLTGLSRTSASFQARSAFTGAGFTTAESEAVVKHPVRRRIICLGARTCGEPNRLCFASYAERHSRAIVSFAGSDALASVGRTACG